MSEEKQVDKEIVRCKDCALRYTTDCASWHTDESDNYFHLCDDEEFCSKGVRRQDFHRTIDEIKESNKKSAIEIIGKILCEAEWLKERCGNRAEVVIVMSKRVEKALRLSEDLEIRACDCGESRRLGGYRVRITNEGTEDLEIIVGYSLLREEGVG